MDRGLCFESVPVNSLKIICWVPRRIKQYNNIGTNKIKTQSTSPKNEKQEQQKKQNLKNIFCVLGLYQSTLHQ